MRKIYKAWNILLSSEKRKLEFLILLKIIGMCLEVLGIALIIPLVSVLLRNETEFFNIDISSFFNLFNYENQFSLTTLVVIFTILVYLFGRNIF